METSTQKEQILRYLETGRGLTALEALHRFHCLRLAARIADLKQDGHPIVAGNKSITDENGNRKTVKEYWLAKEGVVG